MAIRQWKAEDEALEGAATATAGELPVRLPDAHYLNRHYWWAYVHPRSVWVFERPWLVNLILFGNYTRLVDAVLRAFPRPLPGRTLQVACAYGSLTPRLAAQLAPDGTLEVVDILTVQLDNLRRKLPEGAAVQLKQMDSASLDYPEASFDRVLLFFLLHEQPDEVRRRTLAEALRVLRPGGTLLVVDYARPRWWNPLRWTWGPLIARLEPFAPDLWRTPVPQMLPAGVPHEVAAQRRYFGGVYQSLEITRR